MKACKTHESFKPVPAIQIINTLRIHDRAKWMPAIEAMVRHYAGAEIRKPCGALENYLVGKRERHDPYNGKMPESKLFKGKS